MSAATWKKLSKLGYDEKFIKSICTYRKDSSKRYELRVTDIEDLNDVVNPKNGVFICYACFNTKAELAEICNKLEGFAYELTDTFKHEDLGSGIIDDCLIDEMEGKYEIKLTRKEVASVLSDMLYEHQCNSAFIGGDEIEKQIEYEERKQALEIAIELFSKGR